MLKITKKGDKYWLFEDSEIGLFSPSKFTINLLNNVITIVYENGLKSKNYNVIDCEIYDLGATSPFTTSSGDLFMQKLEELNCPCFQKNENIFNISGGAWGDITGNLSNQTDLQIALDSKLDKVSTAGVERAYIINADGSQGTKATSDFKDVLEFANLASFPVTGESEKIYIDLFYNLLYRWSGITYVPIGGSKPQYDTYFQFLTTRQPLTATGTWRTWIISYSGTAFWSTPENADRGTGADPAYNTSDYCIISTIDDNRFLDFLTWEDASANPSSKQIRVEKFDVLIAGATTRINRRTVIDKTIWVGYVPFKKRLQATDSFDTPTGYNSIYVLYIKDVVGAGLFSTRTITWNFKKL